MARKKPTDPDTFEPGKVHIVSNLAPASMNKLIPRQSPTPNPPPKKTLIRRLLESELELATIRELAEQGASITSIEAVLKWPPGRLRTFLERGKRDMDHKGPYKRFYLLFRSWVGQARSKAETVMAVKTPEKWLDRNSSNRLLESEEDRSLANESLGQVRKPSISTENVVRALEILREQGISIDESIDKGQFKVAVNDDDDKDDDSDDSPVPTRK